MISVSVRLDTREREAALARKAAAVPRAIAQGLNDGGDKTRTQVRRAMREQTGLTKLSSVTSRSRTIRAFPGSLHYRIVFVGKPTKPAEFKTSVVSGPGGGVTSWMWGVAHRFARSFQTATGKLRMRLGHERFPIRGFDGPNLAKEAVEGHVAETFLIRSAEFVLPAINRRLGAL